MVPLGLLFVAVLAVVNGMGHGRRVVCYLGSWAVYRPGDGRFNIEDIDASLCTNLVYSFAGLDNTTYEIKSLDPEYDLNKEAFKRFVNLKQQNPRLKVTIAIGGWGEGSTKYSTMAANPAHRRVFIKSVVTFIRQHAFDGLDLDWEYPTQRGGLPEDKNNFVILCQELREEFDKYGWLLTAAVSASKNTVEPAYDVPSLAKYLHFIHIMAYDYHGKWDGHTGHNAPLYAREDESQEEKVLNVEASVKLYLSMGVPPEKLVLGLAFYGRTFLLQDKNNPGISAPAKASAFAGPYTREDGMLGFNEICEKQKREAGQWKLVFQKAHQAPYMFRDDLWVSYDDTNSIQLKVEFAKQKGLAGVMVWSIETDDFRGTCFTQKYPLLRAINRALELDISKPMHPDMTDRPDTHDHDDPATKPDIHHHDNHEIHPGKPDVDLDVDNDISKSHNSKSEGVVGNKASSFLAPSVFMWTLILLAMS